MKAGHILETAAPRPDAEGLGFYSATFPTPPSFFFEPGSWCRPSHRSQKPPPKAPSPPTPTRLQVFDCRRTKNWFKECIRLNCHEQACANTSRPAHRVTRHANTACCRGKQTPAPGQKALRFLFCGPHRKSRRSPPGFWPADSGGKCGSPTTRIRPLTRPLTAARALCFGVWSPFGVARGFR